VALIHDWLFEALRAFFSLFKSAKVNWQVLCEYSGGGSFERLFMYGNHIDEPIMTYSGGIYFYVHDHLYSTAALVDASGEVKGFSQTMSSFCTSTCRGAMWSCLSWGCQRVSGVWLVARG